MANRTRQNLKVDLQVNASKAVIERFWRSLKEELPLNSDPPLTLGDLEGRLRVSLLHYAYLRPHQALLGAVPAEVYFRIRPAHERAVSPPRGRPQARAVGRRSSVRNRVSGHCPPPSVPRPARCVAGRCQKVGRLSVGVARVIYAQL